MATSSVHQAIGSFKDQTSIVLAKLSSSSSSISLLKASIVKATRHDDKPTPQRHVAEILDLTCYSRTNVRACVNALCKRLHKTRNWVVALKALTVVHRLLSQGDPYYEHEISFRTWHGTRLLNMSDFRDASPSDAWEFAAVVLMVARYLDEQLELRINGLTKLRSEDGGKKAPRQKHRQEEDGYYVTLACASLVRGTRMEQVLACSSPVRKMKIEEILTRSRQLQELLDRFLACRPAGQARTHRVVIFALEPLVIESFHIYYHIADLVGILMDRFMELEIQDCMKVVEIFCRASKQFKEMDNFYNWCKIVGIGRFSQYPKVLEMITPKKIGAMESFIRDMAALAGSGEAAKQEPLEESLEDDRIIDIMALPAPVEFIQEMAPSEGKEEEEEDGTKKVHDTQEAKLINFEDDTVLLTGQDYGDRLALALFDGAPAPAPWVTFDDESDDWETALVQSASKLANQRAELGGNLDMLLLDSMYQHAPPVAGYTGSASSMAAPAVLLALPAPPAAASNALQWEDPFAASLAIAPPAYVQMWDMEKKQQLLVVEQLMWEQYARNGMQGQYYYGLDRLQGQQQYYPYPLGFGGYPQSYWA